MVNKWELTGRIKASRYRSLILKQLAERECTPKELENATGIKFSHISRALKELEKWKVVRCKNPKLRKGRIYEITGLGKEIKKRVC